MNKELAILYTYTDVVDISWGFIDQLHTGIPDRSLWSFSKMKRYMEDTPQAWEDERFSHSCYWRKERDVCLKKNLVSSTGGF